MTSANIENNDLESNDKKNDYEIINFINWFKLIRRNKFLIGSLTLTSFALAIIFSLTIKKIWEGQFQIVLSSEDSKISRIDPLANLVGISSPNDLKTEVEILQSPSVLMPIFQYSLSLKKNNNNNNQSFLDWKENFRIDLKKGTKVLNISYRDTNKESIISVLNKMSEKYQQYSGKNLKRSQEITTNYLNKQIINYKNKSSESLKVAQEFAIDQDLVFPDIYSDSIVGGNNEIGFVPIPNINLENMRVNAANEIRIIDSQIAKLKSLKNAEELQYIGASIPFLVEQGLPENLKTIEENLANLRVNYTEESEPIKRILEERQFAIELLKKRAINYLEAAKMEAEARIEAALRPKGVLLKYKELIRAAYRDEATLVSLENQLRKFEIETSKQMDPWELITRPTLLNSPVAPNKKEIAFYGFIIGFLISILFAFYREKKSTIVFTKDDLEKLIFPIKPLVNLDLKEPFEVNNNLSFLKNILIYQSSAKLFFVSLGSIDPYFLEKLKDEFLSTNSNKELEFIKSNDDLKLLNNNECYLLAKLGSVKSSDILLFKKTSDLINLNIKGLIVID